MTTSSDEGTQLEQAVRHLAQHHASVLAAFQPLDPVPYPDEPLVFVAPSGRQYALETRVLDVTGWEHEQ